MSKFEIIGTSFEGLCLIRPSVFSDQRGMFRETYNEKEFEKIGIPKIYVQDNHSRSKKGTLRGLHYQVRKPQAKLIIVARGSVFDVAVDLRRDSDTYGKWYGAVLSEENALEVFIPEGFAHGFLALSDTDFLYKCSTLYDPQDEAGIIWNDREIGIRWPLREYGIDEPLLSEKDKKWPTLKELKFSRFED
ncbi:MAG TPA: dTDP-4-dehydrorhamnose 3,5-epimerase [Mesotoga infera]|uniref:dTDP-4-dehydrorhamnose 3,5-epimerase n=1 Tax=Mesotoga infera TaxID=1236046 RepID=A0A7C1CTK3_9BACT|nr:dTDP-4-dehydrorhamnose 3,5-epimerase [Mesotoga infera]